MIWIENVKPIVEINKNKGNKTEQITYNKKAERTDSDDFKRLLKDMEDEILSQPPIA